MRGRRTWKNPIKNIGFFITNQRCMYVCVVCVELSLNWVIFFIGFIVVRLVVVADNVSLWVIVTDNVGIVVVVVHLDISSVNLSNVMDR